MRRRSSHRRAGPSPSGLAWRRPGGARHALASWRPRTSGGGFPSVQMSPTRETGFFGVSGMSSGSVLPAVAASGNTSSNEKMSRSFSPESASGRRSVSQEDVSLDVRLSMTRNARAWRAGMVTTGAAVHPIKTAALYRVSPATITPLGSATIACCQPNRFRDAATAATALVGRPVFLTGWPGTPGRP